MVVARARVVVPLVVVAALVLGAGGSARATQPAHWEDRTVVVRDEVGGATFRDALQQAVRGWNAVGADLRLTVAKGVGRGCRELRAGEILVCGTRLEGRQVGEARSYLDGNRHIYAATVQIDLRVRSQADLVSLLCHELGHTLGLVHRDARSSCMYQEIGATAPDEQDRRDLRERYRHQEPKRCGRLLLRIGDC